MRQYNLSVSTRELRWPTVTCVDVRKSQRLFASDYPRDIEGAMEGRILSLHAAGETDPETALTLSQVTQWVSTIPGR